MQDKPTENFLQRMVAKRDQGGFTLIELLIVIIILAILAAIVVFAVGSTNTNAIVSSCNADAKSVETAVQAYEAQYPSHIPGDVNALTTSIGVSVNGVSETIGPWLKEAPATNNYTITLASDGNVLVNGSSFDASPNPCNSLS